MKTGFHFKLGVGIILVFGVLIAGYWSWPGISKKIWPLRRKLVFEETFEDYKERDDQRFISHNTIRKPKPFVKPGCKSNTCIRFPEYKKYAPAYIIPQPNEDCFCAILENKFPLILEFDLNLPESKRRLAPVATGVCYGAKGWVHGSGCQYLLVINKDGITLTGGDIISRANFVCNRWHHIKIDMSNNKFIYSIDGRKYTVTGRDLLSYRDFDGEIEFVFGSSRTCYIDNIRFFRLER